MGYPTVENRLDGGIEARLRPRLVPRLLNLAAIPLILAVLNRGITCTCGSASSILALCFKRVVASTQPSQHIQGGLGLHVSSVRKATRASWRPSQSIGRQAYRQ